MADGRSYLARGISLALNCGITIEYPMSSKSLRDRVTDIFLTEDELDETLTNLLGDASCIACGTPTYDTEVYLCQKCMESL